MKNIENSSWSLLPSDVCMCVCVCLSLQGHRWPISQSLIIHMKQYVKCQPGISSKAHRWSWFSPRRPGWLVQRTAGNDRWNVALSVIQLLLNLSKVTFGLVAYLQECHSSYFTFSLPPLSWPSRFTAVLFCLTSRWRCGQNCNITFMWL